MLGGGIGVLRVVQRPLRGGAGIFFRRVHQEMGRESRIKLEWRDPPLPEKNQIIHHAANNTEPNSLPPKKNLPGKPIPLSLFVPKEENKETDLCPPVAPPKDQRDSSLLTIQDAIGCPPAPFIMVIPPLPGSCVFPQGWGWGGVPGGSTHHHLPPPRPLGPGGGQEGKGTRGFLG